jgi:hypothetical protein
MIAADKVKVVIFGDDHPVTEAEYRQMSEAVVEWHYGVECVREMPLDQAEAIGVDLSWLDDCDVAVMCVAAGKPCACEVTP